MVKSSLWSTLAKAFSSLAQRHINKQTVLRIPRTVGLCPWSTVYPAQDNANGYRESASVNLESRESESTKDPIDGDKLYQVQ